MVVTSAKSPVTWRTISPRMEKLATTLILSWAAAGIEVNARPATSSALKSRFMVFCSYIEFLLMVRGSRRYGLRRAPT